MAVPTSFRRRPTLSSQSRTALQVHLTCRDLRQVLGGSGLVAGSLLGQPALARRASLVLFVLTLAVRYPAPQGGWGRASFINSSYIGKGNSSIRPHPGQPPPAGGPPPRPRAGRPPRAPSQPASVLVCPSPHECPRATATSGAVAAPRPRTAAAA